MRLNVSANRFEAGPNPASRFFKLKASGMNVDSALTGSVIYRSLVGLKQEEANDKAKYAGA
jgi:hypothetical protein